MLVQGTSAPLDAEPLPRRMLLDTRTTDRCGSYVRANASVEVVRSRRAGTRGWVQPAKLVRRGQSRADHRFRGGAPTRTVWDYRTFGNARSDVAIMYGGLRDMSCGETHAEAVVCAPAPVGRGRA